MRISVLNCSPKGENSLTALSVKYLVKMYPGDEFDFFYVGDGKLPDDVKQACEECNLVIITSSIFHSSIHAQMIGMLDELAETIGTEKPVTYATTSNFLYELGAHRYVEAWAKKKNMNYIRSLSLHDDSVFVPQGREELYRWFAYVKDCMKAEDTPKFFKSDRKAVIIDGGEGESENTAIINALKQQYEQAGAKVEVIALRDYNIKPCTACLMCYSDRKCVFNDDWEKIDNLATQDTDIIIEVGTLRYGSLGERTEIYTDRHVQFGRCFTSDEIVRGYIYSEGSETTAQDAFDLNERFLTVDSLCGSYQAGTLCGYSKNAGLNDLAIKAFVNDTVRIVNNELLPQQNCFGVSFNKNFASLAKFLKNMTPLDYAMYARAGYYRPAPQNDKCRYIQKGTPAQPAKGRTFVYIADYEQFDGNVVLTERRADKRIPLLERMRSIKPLTPEEETALQQPIPVKFG